MGTHSILGAQLYVDLHVFSPYFRFAWMTLSSVVVVLQIKALYRLRSEQGFFVLSGRALVVQRDGKSFNCNQGQ